MLFNGFGFSGYRSFGSDLVKIAPLRKINLIVGQNNVGKSNIVNFLKQQYPFFLAKAKGGRSQYSLSSQEDNFQALDYHISAKQAIHQIAFPLLENEVDEHIDLIWQNRQQNDACKELAKKILISGYLCENNCIWFVYKSALCNGTFEPDIDINQITNILTDQQWEFLWRIMTSQQGGSLNLWIQEVIKYLSYFPPSPPKVEIIPAIRKIGKFGSEASDFSGEGIIEQLAKIQNPSLNNQQDKEKFRDINEFIQNVLENSSAKIEIPYQRDMILVHMDEKILPLESLGTGVHEVIILAAASTLLEDTIVCIEEPELHLHPLLQKKLVRYLSDHTNNQYLFTTHSAHLLNVEESEIFHVTQKYGSSCVEAIFSTKQRANICNDLGFKASDILQANCIIWVEGPSDRIYLNYWLKGRQSDFIEGIHYSIMFYGGKLFSHLTALDDDEEVDCIDDFISVRKLNRNTAIMFDSDKSNFEATISLTKQRLQQEFDKGPGFAWITEGREIENYLDMDRVETAILKVHKTAEKIIDKNKWSNLLKYIKKNSGEENTANKVRVAKYYTENNHVNFGVFDLDEKLNRLIEFIRISNGL